MYTEKNLNLYLITTFVKTIKFLADYESINNIILLIGEVNLLFLNEQVFIPSL